MNIHKGTWYIHKARTYLEEGFYVTDIDMSDAGHVLLGEEEFEFEFETPDTDPIEAEISMLSKEADRLETESYAKVQNIKDRIKQLQCLEYKPEPEVMESGDE